jgi:hypothetical protein
MADESYESYDGLEYRLIVSGGRAVTDVDLVQSGLSEHIAQLASVGNRVTMIIHGMASGVDTIAGNYGRDHNLRIVEFPADWERYGRAAGPIRNKEMIEYGDELLAFWDGKSKGTGGTIKLARRAGIPVSVIPVPRR